MLMVLVSVVMCSYNHERYIGQAIESVLNQTFHDLELVIVDDCSRDGSQKIIEAYQAKDSRVKASFHPKNRGIAATTNDCLKHVTGRYLSFIGSDDLWMETKLERQIAALHDDEDRLVWSDGLIVNGDGVPTGETITHYIGPSKRSGNLFEDLLREHIVSFQSLIFNAQYAKGLELDESLKYVSDHRFIVEIAKNHPFYFIDEPLAKYRVHGSNITSRDMSVWMKERIRIRHRFLREYVDVMSPQTRADIYHKIGHAYANLGEPLSARHYYMKALFVNRLNPNSVLYLMLAATAGGRYSGEAVTNMYYRFRPRF